MRSKHGTVTQAATQTIDWFSDGEDGCYGDSHTPDGGGGPDGSRNGYQRNRNKFRIFNQRMDFSHVQSKVVLCRYTTKSSQTFTLRFTTLSFTYKLYVANHIRYVGFYTAKNFVSNY